MSDIKAYEISVQQTAIDRLQQKLALVDLPDELDDAGWDYGASLPEVKKLITYWQNDYNWRKHEAKLNELPNYTTAVEVDGFGELQIHFIHQESSVKNAVPLLFCHGCQWSSKIYCKNELLTICRARKLHRGEQGVAFAG